MAEEIEVRLSRMRRAMAKMAAEGREAEFAALDTAYEALKRERDTQERARLQAERVRVRRAAAERAVEEPQRWRLPRGFGRSPLAQARDRDGRREVQIVSVSRRGLSPWRRYGSSMSEVIWRPGSR